MQFHLAPSDYSLMQENTVIIGMSNFPLSTNFEEQSKNCCHSSLKLIIFLGIPTLVNHNHSPEPNNDNSLIIVGGAIAVAGVIDNLLKNKQKKNPVIQSEETQNLSLKHQILKLSTDKTGSEG